MTDLDLFKLKKKIKSVIILLWQSDEVRSEKINVLDEVRRNLYYIEQTLFAVVPSLIDDLQFLICDYS